MCTFKRSIHTSNSNIPGGDQSCLQCITDAAILCNYLGISSLWVIFKSISTRIINVFTFGTSISWLNTWFRSLILAPPPFVYFFFTTKLYWNLVCLWCHTHASTQMSMLCVLQIGWTKPCFVSYRIEKKIEVTKCSKVNNANKCKVMHNVLLLPYIGLTCFVA